MIRRTKIIATLGPATDSEEVLHKIIEAGVDVVRINLSHGNHEQHQKRIDAVRECSEQLAKPVGILLDLQGPKIRIARFINDTVILNSGDKFILDSNFDALKGTEKIVGLDYPELINDIFIGDKLLLDDGRVVLEVMELIKSQIVCNIIVGGKLSNNKGINKQGGGLSAAALTAKDSTDIKFSAKVNADYVSVSFTRNAVDINIARDLLKKAGSNAAVLAKIERSEALHCLDEIINAADGVMVARGDLGVEIGLADLPSVQKKIILRARKLNKPVVTATQMMESMITEAIPTRAEVSDVANAVMDVTDAVMLSAETAVGKSPETVVQAMSDICIAAEQQVSTQKSKHRIEGIFTRIDEAVAMATMYTANHLDVQAIVALTETGSTPLWMSRIRTGVPIYAVTSHKLTAGKMTLYRDVYPVVLDLSKYSKDSLVEHILQDLLHLKFIIKGSNVIITKGDVIGVAGGVNTMQIIQV